jgi:hypothetical protein
MDYMKEKMQAKVRKVMKEYSAGKLKSSSGQKVKSRPQAIAVGMSEARKVTKNK